MPIDPSPTEPLPPRRGSAGLRRLVRCTGISLAAAGSLLGAFWFYLQWGTGFVERSVQARLGTELVHRRAGPRAGRGRAVAAAPYQWPALPDGAPLARITIPAIGLDQVVVQGTDAADLREGPGHYEGTPYPGQDGNVAIAGHRTTYARPFFDLDALLPGDTIRLSVPGDTWDYRVTGSMVVLPEDVAVAGPLGRPGGWLTLTTCNPRYSAATRLVVRAELAGAAEPVPVPPPRPPRGRPAGEWRRPPVRRSLPSGRASVAWPVAGWTLALAGATGAGGLLARRRRRLARLAVLVPTGAVVLVLLFELFGAVAGHLPPGY